MSWKSIGWSIFSLVVTIGLLFLTTFLFNILTVLGIIGIVALVVVPFLIRHKALAEARGVVDKVFAKFLIPIATVILGTMTVFMLLGLIPFPFK